MISAWGVDHGSEVSKRLGRRMVAYGGLGVGGGLAADAIARRTDKGYAAKAAAEPKKLAAAAGAGAGTAGLLYGGPIAAAGMGGGAAAAMYVRNRKKKQA